jgi:hypothetical protein
VKVFISWSGEQSRRVAEVLRDWLPSVVQAVLPYVSSEDIEKGARWSADVSRELDLCHFGILCVTRDNMGAPWLNFEAGALSKSFEKGRVTPFLFGVDRANVVGPLVQFQSTVCTRSDVHRLVRDINAACAHSLDDARLDTVFAMWWPRLEVELGALLASPGRTSGPTPDRSVEDMLAEVLDIVRDQQILLAGPTGQLLDAARRARTRGYSDLPRPLVPRELLRDVARSWKHLDHLASAFGDEPVGVFPAEVRIVADDLGRGLDQLLGILDGPPLR